MAFRFCLRRGVPFVLALAVALASARAIDAGQCETDPCRAAALVTRWRVIVLVQYEALKAVNNDAVDALVDRLLSDGAVAMIRERAKEPRIKQADEAVKRFVAAMVKAGQRQPDGSVDLDEAAFDAGYDAVCPLEPFCRPD
jgi:hypothetical protein